MIDYATWCAIRDGIAKHLTPSQLAASLGLDVKTVRHWIGRPYARRAGVPRSSQLDPFKGRIVGWLDAHPLTARQVFQRLCEAGYDGGISIVKDYVRTIRPRPRKAFLTLAFAPGELAQVDLGRIRYDRRRPHPPAPVVLRDGAGLQPAAVCRVHPGADDGALPDGSHQRLPCPGCAAQGDGRQSPCGGAAPRPW